jgi:hypothetical protein
VDERIRFIEHKGKQILFLDFSLATALQMLPLLQRVQTTVAQHGPKSVLILADYEGAEIDGKVAMKIKEVLALDRPFVKKAAWLGTEHIPHAPAKTSTSFPSAKLRPSRPGARRWNGWYGNRSTAGRNRRLRGAPPARMDRRL